MNAVVIGLAALHDREALCQLYHAFHEFHVRALPDRLLSLGEPPQTYEGSDLYLALEQIIRDEDAAILLAEVGGQPVGLAEVYLRQDEANPLRAACRYGYLQSLVVAEAFRQRGVGTRLLEAAHQWSRAKGASEMRLDTWEFEQGPLGFYERLGYRTLRRTLVRML